MKPMENYEQIREALKTQRKELRLTSRQVGEKMGTVASYVTRLERGDIASPSLGVIIRWANAVNLKLSVILEDEFGDIEKEPES